jgi:hypothetical protein
MMDPVVYQAPLLAHHGVGALRHHRPLKSERDHQARKRAVPQFMQGLRRGLKGQSNMRPC